eukprot:s35_g52.t2
MGLSENRDERQRCAVTIFGVMVNAALGIGAISSSVSTCAGSVNVPANCAANVNAFIGNVLVLAGTAMAADLSCPLDPLPDRIEERQVELQEARDDLQRKINDFLIRNKQPVTNVLPPNPAIPKDVVYHSISRCVAHLDLAVTFVMKAGVIIADSTLDCSEEELVDADDERVCAINIIGLMGVLSLATRFFALASNSCVQIVGDTTARAGCAADIAGINAGVYASVAPAMNLQASCIKAYETWDPYMWPRRKDLRQSATKQALENHHVSEHLVTEVLRLLEIPASQTRKKLMPTGQKSVHKVVFGLYSHGGKVQITTFTKQCPWTTKLLTAFVQQKYPGFYFTSIQVNFNNKCPPHVDRNDGTSLIIGLGDYKGGEIFVAHPNGTDLLQLSKAVAGYQKGANVPGDYVDIKSKWLEFDGRSLHAVKPFKGTRFTLVYYTCPEYRQASPNVRMACTDSGFKYPLLQQLVRAVDPGSHQAAAASARAAVPVPKVAKTGPPRKRVRPRKDATTSRSGALGGPADPADGCIQVAAVKKTYALLKVNSNQKGGGGTANFRKAMAALRRVVKKLPEELRLQIFTLLDASEDKENFEAKTSGTWRRFLPPILELLGVTDPELEQAKKDANPRELSMDPVNKVGKLLPVILIGPEAPCCAAAQRNVWWTSNRRAMWSSQIPRRCHVPAQL